MALMDDIDSFYTEDEPTTSTTAPATEEQPTVEITSVKDSGGNKWDNFLGSLYGETSQEQPQVEQEKPTMAVGLPFQVTPTNLDSGEMFHAAEKGYSLDQGEPEPGKKGNWLYENLKTGYMKGEAAVGDFLSNVASLIESNTLNQQEMSDQSISLRRAGVLSNPLTSGLTFLRGLADEINSSAGGSDNILGSLKNYFKNSANAARPEPEANPTIPGAVVQGVAELPATLSMYLLGTALTGGNAVGGMALIDGIKGADKGTLGMIEGAIKGGMLGKILHALNIFSVPVKVGAMGSIFGGMTAVEGGGLNDTVASAILGGGLAYSRRGRNTSIREAVREARKPFELEREGMNPMAEARLDAELEDINQMGERGRVYPPEETGGREGVIAPTSELWAKIGGRETAIASTYDYLRTQGFSTERISSIMDMLFPDIDWKSDIVLVNKNVVEPTMIQEPTKEQVVLSQVGKDQTMPEAGPQEHGKIVAPTAEEVTLIGGEKRPSIGPREEEVIPEKKSGVIQQTTENKPGEVTGIKPEDDARMQELSRKDPTLWTAEDRAFYNRFMDERESGLITEEVPKPSELIIPSEKDIKDYGKSTQESIESKEAKTNEPPVPASSTTPDTGLKNLREASIDSPIGQKRLSKALWDNVGKLPKKARAEVEKLLMQADMEQDLSKAGTLLEEAAQRLHRDTPLLKNTMVESMANGEGTGGVTLGMGGGNVFELFGKKKSKVDINSLEKDWENKDKEFRYFIIDLLDRGKVQGYTKGEDNYGYIPVSGWDNTKFYKLAEKVEPGLGKRFLVLKEAKDKAFKLWSNKGDEIPGYFEGKDDTFIDDPEELERLAKESKVTPLSLLKKNKDTTLGSGPWQSLYEKFFPETKREKEIKTSRDPFDYLEPYKNGVTHKWQLVPKKSFASSMDIEEISVGFSSKEEVVNWVKNNKDMVMKALNIPETKVTVNTGFYSKLGEIVSQKVGKKVPTDQLQKMLLNAGVKKSEMKWSGMDDFIETFKGQTVTKDQIVNYLKEHELLFNDLDIESPKFERHIRGGGTNYQEKLITFNYPEKGKTQFLSWEEASKDGWVMEFQPSEIKGNSYYRITNPEFPVNTLMVDAATDTPINVIQQRALKEINKFIPMIQESRGIHSGRDYTAGHWSGEPGAVNVIGSMLTRDDTAADGGKILGIREIQSDWDLSARKEGGYQGDKPKEPPKVIESWEEANELGYRMIKGDDPFYPIDLLEGDNIITSFPPRTTKARVLESLNQHRIAKFEQLEKGVPDMPFRDKWFEVVLKRAIKYAIDNGYDYISWSTGQQVAEQYHLNKYVDKINWEIDGGAKQVILDTKEGSSITMFVEKDGKIGEATVSGIAGKDLREVIGKEVAEKIISAKKQGELTGLDLVITPEGKDALYDIMIPSFMNKFAGKQGGKLLDIPLGGRDRSNERIPDKINSDIKKLVEDMDIEEIIYDHGWMSDDGANLTFKRAKSIVDYISEFDEDYRYDQQISIERIEKIQKELEKQMYESNAVDNKIVDEVRSELESWVDPDIIIDYFNESEMTYGSSLSREKTLQMLDVLRDEVVEGRNEMFDTNEEYQSALRTIKNLEKKVQETTVSTTGQPGLKITPELKESIEKKGMPLYSGVDPTKIIDWFKSKGKKNEVVAEKAGRSFNRILDFFDPGLSVPDSNHWFYNRQAAKGGVAEGEYIAEGFTKLYKDILPDDRRVLWDFMNGTKPLNELPDHLKMVGKELRSLDNKLGRMLVNAGIMSEETFEAMKDRHIRYIYNTNMSGENFVAGSQAGAKIPYKAFEQRKELTDVEMDRLGLIRDPIKALTQSIVEVHKATAMKEYFEKVASNEKWIYQPAILEFEGRKMGIGKAKDIVSTINTIEKTNPHWLNAEQLEYRNSLKVAIEAKEKDMQLPSGEFVQLNGKHYGELDGMYVNRTIANDMKPIFSMAQKFDSELLRKTNYYLDTATSIWKLKSVALNIPTASRNCISNTAQMWMSGMPLYKMPRYFYRAAEAVKSKTEIYEQALKQGLFKGNWSASELNDLLEIAKTEGKGLDSVLEMGRKLGKYYGKIDDFFKMAKFIEGMDKGLGEAESARLANRWGMDYSLAHPSVKYIRSTPLGAPFITYQYKVLPLIAEAMMKRPWTVMSIVALPYILNKIITKDMTDEEAKKYNDSLPEYVKNGQTLLIPGVNGMHAMDISYMVPWGNWWQTATEVAKGDIPKASRETGIAGGLIPSLLYALKTGKDLFTGEDIISPLEKQSPKLTTMALTKYLWNQSMPGMFSTYGLAGKTYQHVTSGKTKTGMETEWQDIYPRLAGVNIYPLDPRSGMIQKKHDINEVKKALYKKMMDRSLSEEERDDIRQIYKQAVGEIIKK